MSETRDGEAVENDDLDAPLKEDVSEEAIDALRGLPLDEFLVLVDPAASREALGSFGMIKVAVAAREVFGSGEGARRLRP